MTHETGLATLLALPQHRQTSPSAVSSFDRDTITQTAESIVHDILQIVAAGRIDEDARLALRDWIVDAWLALPTAEHIDQLCRAAGFTGPVSSDLMRQRVDELHHTIAAQLQELGQCHERLAVFQAASQSIVAVWEQGDLAYAVRRLAALLPK
jgi:hypothetical protein